MWTVLDLVSPSFWQIPRRIKLSKTSKILIYNSTGHLNYFIEHMLFKSIFVKKDVEIKIHIMTNYKSKNDNKYIGQNIYYGSVHFIFLTSNKQLTIN